MEKALVRLGCEGLYLVQNVAEDPMSEPILCVQCDKPEAKCACEKYCMYCQAQYDVRLCEDGLYYCPDCREACEMLVANRSGR